MKDCTTPAPPAAVVLEHLTKRYGDVVAAGNVSIRVEGGDMLALIGPSGSGKTTVLRMIGGFTPPTSGRITVGDRVVADDDVLVPPERRSVGIVFQGDSCFPHLTVAKNVGFGLASMRRTRRRERVAELLDLVGLGGLDDRYPHELSGGQRQRVAIARALGPEPAVMLLDEPFAHLDPALRGPLGQELRRVLQRERTTGILVTHDRSEALSLSDRIAVMSDGRLLQVGRPTEAFHVPACPVAATILGDGALVGARCGGGRMHTPLGALEPVRPVEDDEVVSALVRPDDVDVVPDPEGTATIIGVRFLGGEVSYTVELLSGEHIMGHSHHHAPLEVGTRVGIRLRAQRFAWFAPEQALPPGSGR